MFDRDRNFRPIPSALAATVALIALSAPVAAESWKPIPPEHLAQTGPIVESSVDAEAQLWIVQVEDVVQNGGLVSIREHFIRVKVFTQKGAQDWARHDLDYPARDVSISDISARTVLPDGKELTMDRSAISHETIVKTSSGSIRRTSFALSGVQPGSIVEYRYTEHRRDENAYADGYPFQLTIPVQKVVYRIKPLAYPGLVMRQLTFHIAPQSAGMQKSGYYEITAVNQPAFATEVDMPPEAQERAYMVLFYTDAGESSPDKYWSSVGRKQADWFNDFTKPDDGIRKATREFTRNAQSDREKLESIASGVRREFRVVRSNSIDSLKAAGLRESNSARDAWHQRGGTYLDGELVFAALARAAGLEVRWAMVPPRTDVFFNQSMLSEGFLSSYQVAVRSAGGWTTYDPLSRYLPWDMQRWSEEAMPALLCDRDSTRFIETSFSQPERTVRSRRSDLELKPDGTLEGTMHATWTGHLNEDLREIFNLIPADRLDSLATADQISQGADLRLSRVEILRGRDDSDPVHLVAHVELPQFATVTGKRILLEPALFYARAKPRYTASKRVHPVYYPHPWSEIDTVLIHLPEGWKVGSVDSPEPLSATGVASYSATVAVSDDRRQVLYMRTFRMGVDASIFFPAGSYGAVRKLFEGIQQRDRVSLELTKSESSP